MKILRNSRSYKVQYLVSDVIITDDANWRDGDIVAASKRDLQGLPQRQLVWVRVRAIGAGEDNVGAWSDAVAMSAQ